MRITNQQMTSTVLSNLLQRGRGLAKAQEQVATQKRINAPSDDPIGMAEVLGYRTTLNSIDQYQRNIQRGQTRIEMAETVLGQVQDLLTEAKKVAADQATGSGDVDTRQVAAGQVQQIRDQVLQLANSQLNDAYIFAGRASGSPPFVEDAAGNVSYVGDNSADADARTVIGDGVEASIRANGEEIFGAAADVFAVLKDLSDELQLPAPDRGVIGTHNNQLQAALGQLEVVRSDNASVFNRLEMTSNQLHELHNKVETMRSDTEDADMADSIMQLQVQQTAYETALASAAKVIQRTLLDYIG